MRWAIKIGAVVGGIAAIIGGLAVPLWPLLLAGGTIFVVGIVISSE